MANEILQWTCQIVCLEISGSFTQRRVLSSVSSEIAVTCKDIDLVDTAIIRTVVIGCLLVGEVL